MRKLAICLSVCLCAAGPSVAQQASQPNADASAPVEKLESYVVQLSEYRMVGPTDPSQTAAEIVALLTNPGGEGKNEPLETIRLSTLSGTESMVQFGKQVSVTIGAVNTRGSTSRQTQRMQIGTLVRVTATPQADKVALKLLFESSRLEGEGTDDSPPDISTTEINTTQLLEFGKPTLIGGTSAGASSFIILTVTR